MNNTNTTHRIHNSTTAKDAYDSAQYTLGQSEYLLRIAKMKHANEPTRRTKYELTRWTNLHAEAVAKFEAVTALPAVAAYVESLRVLEQSQKVYSEAADFVEAMPLGTDERAARLVAIHALGKVVLQMNQSYFAAASVEVSI